MCERLEWFRPEGEVLRVLELVKSGKLEAEIFLHYDPKDRWLSKKKPPSIAAIIESAEITI